MTTILSPFLRRVLLADAATCIACGLLLTVGATPLTGLFGLSPGLLFGAGLSLFPVAAFILWLATRREVSAAFVRLVIIGNIIWAADSLLLLLTPWVAPTLLGAAFVVAQALIVIGFARAEQVGLRGALATA